MCGAKGAPYSDFLSEAELGGGFLQRLGRALQSGELLVGDRGVDGVVDALTVEEGRHGHADVGDAVEVLEHGAHGQNAVGVVQDGFDDVDAGHADGRSWWHPYR